MRQGAAPKLSTNPFDGDSSSSSQEEELFHDAQQDEEAPRQRQRQQRLAPLNFDDNPFDGVEDPALQFNHHARQLSNDFVSPLESAMMQLGTNPRQSPRQDTGYSTFANYHNAHVNNDMFPPLEEQGNDDDIDDDDDEITEGSALLQSVASSPTGRSPGSSRRRIPTEISTGGRGGRTVALRRRSSTTTNTTTTTRRKSSLLQASSNSKNVVLKELASGENEFTVDYKYILLEDLGTASSWLILLLPYVAFFLALLLESSKSLKVATMDPLVAKTSCVGVGGELVGRIQPLIPAPTAPCHTSFQGRLVDLGHYTAMSGEYNKTMINYSGTAFESGVLPSIPVLSTYIFGDVIFQGLTTETVAMVSRGMVEASVVVLQQPNKDYVVSSYSNDDDDDDHHHSRSEWTLMFTSKPKRLSMACQRTLEDSSLWDCKTPRLIDVVFSMPDSAVYAAGNLRVNIYYSLKKKYYYPQGVGTGAQIIESSKDDTTTTMTLSSSEFDTVWVYTKSKNDSWDLASTEISELPSSLLKELVAASVYTLEHMSDLAMILDTGVRLSTFLISFLFVIYWCYSMGVHESCKGCCGSHRKKEGKKNKSILNSYIRWKVQTVLLLVAHLVHEYVECRNSLVGIAVDLVSRTMVHYSVALFIAAHARTGFGGHDISSQPRCEYSLARGC
jgi:hypothetical protein